MKRLAYFLVAIILLVSLTFGCAPAAPEGMDKVTFRSGWLYTANFAPAFVGLEKGFWADEGIDIILKPGAGVPNTQLIAAGVEMFADEGYPDLIEAVQAGMQLKAILGYGQQTPEAIISRADNPIHHPKDLEGKTIAGSAGAGGLALLPGVMKAAGADFDKVTVRIVGMGADIPMLMLGEVDAIPRYWPTNVPRIEEGGVEAYYISIVDYGMNMFANGLITSTELIAENPDLVRRFVRAAQKAWVYTDEHPDEAADIFLKYNPDWEKETVLFGIAGYSQLRHTERTMGKPLGWMAKEDWEQTQDIMIEYLGLEGRLPVETYYTNEFIPE